MNDTFESEILRICLLGGFDDFNPLFGADSDISESCRVWRVFNQLAITYTYGSCSCCRCRGCRTGAHRVKESFTASFRFLFSQLASCTDNRQLLQFTLKSHCYDKRSKIFLTNLTFYFTCWRFSNCRSCKGQLISKCPYEKSVSSKIPTKIFLDFCPAFFCSFLGASW